MNIFEIKQNQKKVILLLHEIYGINDHMKHYANYYADFDYDVICPNLIKLESPFRYDDEHQAYLYFTDTIGFKSAAFETKKLIEELSSEYEEIHIIGFSVGATVAWLCSELKEVDRIVCFYGSRIRNYLELTPACPVLCIYGESEKSFDVTLLVNQLQKKRIESHIYTGAHGFADPYSKEFKHDTYNKAKEIVNTFLLKKISD
ncbi:dienelactone hydrolase family protein [Rummeliibacillus pycnus]|uniref:dienelactone hydrolase family protein n=1 Tax=Rummeliibacillus pycnus TaxID=101070 RepID=UPI0037C81499